MSTQEQINANRQNAQKSTGPKTDEGKAAVSQNAVKHGLFAESVIEGENEADYEAFHDEMLAELAPVGSVESMLAERVISLWWRLRRAERMQNQVIDDMIGRIVTNRPARRKRECYYINQGIRLNDPRVDLDDLPLGRIANSDWSYCRVLDRMMLYERRIENSVIKLMKELKRFQIMRQIEFEDVEPQFEPDQTIPIPINDNRDEAATQSNYPSNKDEAATRSDSLSQRDEAATRETEQKVDLKKQSQFVPALIGVTPFVKGGYDNNSAAGDDENKAKQSQFSAPASPKGIEKREKSVSAATG